MYSWKLLYIFGLMVSVGGISRNALAADHGIPTISASPRGKISKSEDNRENSRLLASLNSRQAVQRLFQRATLPPMDLLFSRRKTAWVGSCSHFPNTPNGRDSPVGRSAGMLRSWPIQGGPHFNMRAEGDYVGATSDPLGYMNRGADFTYSVRGLMNDRSYLNTSQNLGEITPAGSVDESRNSIQVPAFEEMIMWTHQGGLQIRRATLPSGRTVLVVKEDFHSVPIRFRLGGSWSDPSQHVNEPLGPDVSRYCVLVNDILTPGQPGAEGAIPEHAGAFLH